MGIIFGNLKKIFREPESGPAQTFQIAVRDLHRPRHRQALLASVVAPDKRSARAILMGRYPAPQFRVSQKVRRVLK